MYHALNSEQMIVFYLSY